MYIISRANPRYHDQTDASISQISVTIRKGTFPLALIQRNAAEPMYSFSFSANGTPTANCFSVNMMACAV